MAQKSVGGSGGSDSESPQEHWRQQCKTVMAPRMNAHEHGKGTSSPRIYTLLEVGLGCRVRCLGFKVSGGGSWVETTIQQLQVDIIITRLCKALIERYQQSSC